MMRRKGYYFVNILSYECFESWAEDQGGGVATMEIRERSNWSVNLAVLPIVAAHASS